MMLQPNEIVQYAAKSAEAKSKFGTNKLLVLSFLAGVYISMAGLISVMSGYGMPGLTAENPMLTKLLMGLVFPGGLCLVVLAGAELFTGNTAYFMPAVLSRKASVSSLLKNWTIVWTMNFVGCLFFAYFLVHLTHVADAEEFRAGFQSVANAKTSNPFYVTMLKGIGANWLVCLAMWQGMAAKTVMGKIIGIWWPVMIFVAIGYEHSIANMFIIPMAMFQGADITVGELFCSNLIPATIGNIIGGALFVGTAYWYSYQK